MLARQGMLLLFGDTGGGNELYIYMYIHTRVGCRFVFIGQIVVSLQLSQSLLRNAEDNSTHSTDIFSIINSRIKRSPLLFGGNFNTGSTQARFGNFHEDR